MINNLNYISLPTNLLPQCTGGKLLGMNKP